MSFIPFRPDGELGPESNDIVEQLLASYWWGWNSHLDRRHFRFSQIHVISYDFRSIEEDSALLSLTGSSFDVMWPSVLEVGGDAFALSYQTAHYVFRSHIITIQTCALNFIYLGLPKMANGGSHRLCPKKESHGQDSGGSV